MPYTLKPYVPTWEERKAEIAGIDASSIQVETDDLSAGKLEDFTDV